MMLDEHLIAVLGHFIYLKMSGGVEELEFTLH